MSNTRDEMYKKGKEVVKKWKPLLAGLETEYDMLSCAMLIENTSKELVSFFVNFVKEYADCQSDDLIDFIVGKTLDQFDIEHDLFPSWDKISNR